MKSFPLNKKRLVAVVVFVIAFFLLMDLFGRLTELSRLGNQRDTMATEVFSLTSTLQSLNTQVAYATSAVAVEDWARQEGHMVKSGDVLIVPIQPESVTPMTYLTPVPTAQRASNWGVWWALFFGK
jgi:hypothetical protein